MKNVSWRKLIVVILLAVTVIYPVVLHLDIQRNEAQKQAELESNPDLAPWIDFAPYPSTFTGGLLIIVGVVLVGSWLMVIVHHKKLKSATLIILMFTVVLAFTPKGHAEYFEIVDVLAVEDEEFRWCYPAGWQRNNGWEQYIDDAFEKLKDEFGIIFKLRGWLDWDSRDYTGTLEQLLDEAINETNFESHVTTYDGHVIDILMVFTCEPQEQALGFSPPYLEAMIIYGLADAPRGRLMQHELSHQFWVKHCDNDDCVMKKLTEWFPWISDNWCTTCATTLNDHKHRFWTLPPLILDEPVGPAQVYVNTSRCFWINTILEWRELCYQCDWGDGSTTTTDSGPSGTTIDLYHSWDSTGSYEVRARAQNEYGQWGDWSSSLTVVVEPLPPPGGGGGGGGSGNHPLSPPP